jgi:hypothetical protein
MVCFVFLCTFIRISSTQPFYADDDDDQIQVDNSFPNNYFAASGQLTINNPHRFNVPESLYNPHQQQQQLFYQNKQYNPDNVQLAKRIIMLPRVGRRSIESTFRN